jgi:hypothetical protein
MPSRAGELLRGRYGASTFVARGSHHFDTLPLIQNVPLSRLAKATGLSLRYVSQIRRGEKVPHPRHWNAFRSIPLSV